MEQKINDLVDLTQEQATLLAGLARVEQLTDTFFLTGGTWLKAVGVVPRRSMDLDFFTFAKVSEREYLAGLKRLRELMEELFGREAVRLTDKGLLLKESGMIVDAVADASPKIDEFVIIDGLKAAGMKDVAAHKASAVCSRDEIKDYIDIAFLTADKGWGLLDLAEMAEEKFKIGTINEEKLLTELLAKREAFSVPEDIFLRDGSANAARVERQIGRLIEDVSI